MYVQMLLYNLCRFHTIITSWTTPVIITSIYLFNQIESYLDFFLLFVKCSMTDSNIDYNGILDLYNQQYVRGMGFICLTKFFQILTTGRLSGDTSLKRTRWPELFALWLYRENMLYLSAGPMTSTWDCGIHKEGPWYK